MASDTGGDDIDKRNFYIWFSFSILGGLVGLLLLIAVSLFIRKKILIYKRKKTLMQLEKAKQNKKDNSKGSSTSRTKEGNNEKIVFEGETKYEKINSLTPVDMTTARKLDENFSHSNISNISPNIKINVE